MQNIQFSHPMVIPAPKRCPNSVNQVERKTIQKIVHFNTKFRDNFYNTSSSDFKYNFPMPINNVISMRLRSIDIPNTWYTFSDGIGNNVFIIETKKRRTDLTVFEIVIPNGNYNAIQLSNYLNQKYFCESGKDDDLSYLKINISEIDLKTQFPAPVIATLTSFFNLAT